MRQDIPRPEPIITKKMEFKQKVQRAKLRIHIEMFNVVSSGILDIADIVGAEPPPNWKKPLTDFDTCYKWGEKIFEN